ncbi:MAG TPA: orotate phosphoribosyltransferase [Candidatus Cloacimonadota bacterium]|nr:orotate phosphoribosyltransferase [Candidatus Cloacimonadota bacterium]
MNGNFVTIATFTSIFEADMAKSLLEDSGFEVLLLNERMMSIYPSMAGNMYKIMLQVMADAEAEASLLLQNLDDTYLATEVLKRESALLEGHFCLTSGKHSNRYIEKISILQNPEAVETLCKRLVAHLEAYEFDTVIGPAYGGIVLAYEVARLMGKSFIFTQRKDAEMTIRPGFNLSKVKQAVVIEDILTTGGSIFEVISCVKRYDIEIQAIGVLVNRSPGTVDFGIPLHSLLAMEVPAWDPQQCELCKLGVPLSKPGSSDKSK